MSAVLEMHRPMLSLNTSVVRSLEDLLALEEQWQDLVNDSEAPNTFEQFDWIVGWWKQFGRSCRLMIILAWDGSGQLVGSTPFYISRSVATLGLKRLGLLGDRHVGSDYLGVIARSGYSQSVAQEVARELLRLSGDWDYIECRDSAKSEANLILFRQLSESGLIRDVRQGYPCRFISLPGNFDSYLNTIGGNLRGNYRRRLRNLEKDHTVEFLCVRSGEEFEHAYRQLLQLHANRFEARQTKSAFTGDTDIETFHVDVAQALARRGLARLFQLKVDGEVVAALYGFQVADKFQFFQCGMLPAWLNAGVGQITIGLSIKGAMDLGCTEFDFLRGDESYKTKWAIEVRHTEHVFFYPRKLAPLTFKTLARLHEQARQSFKMLIRKKPAVQPERES